MGVPVSVLVIAILEGAGRSSTISGAFMSTIPATEGIRTD
jgi:hypothetical protein